MKKGKKVALFAGIGVVLVAAIVVLVVVLSSGHRVIKVDDMDGQVSLERESAEKDIVEGMKLKSKDMITTGDDGLLELLVDSDKHILAKQNTCFEIVSNGNEKKGKLKIKLEYGSSLIEIENKLNDNSSVEVETPNASLSVRGTTFEVSYSKEDKSTFVEVTDGVVEVKVGDETKKVKKGQTANVSEAGVTVTYKDFQYSDVPAFEIGHSENGKVYDVYMKELKDWNHEVSTIGEVIVDEMVKDGVRIRYWVETKEEIDENLEYLEGADFLDSEDTFTNDDGDEIQFAISGYEDDNGDFVATYRYYKKLPDGMYVSLTVFSFDNLTIVGKKDKEEYLPLTNDCYFFIGLPEGVEEPEEGIGTPTVEEEPEEDVQEEEDSFDIGNVEPGTIVAKEDVSKIFRNEITYDELEFMLRVLEGARVTPRFDIVGTGVNMIWYEPELADVYSPVEGTAYDYDVDMLNRLFSMFTSIKIREDNIPSYATLNGDVLTLEPCTLEDYGDVTISIYTFCFNEDNQILLEYEYVRTNDSSGSSGVKGNSCVVFVPDENGKYQYEYSMEYGSNPF